MFGARPELAELVDRYELFNRHTLFSWVATAGHPTVATGDFHRLEHLATWKTLLPCAKDEPSVITYLRSARPAYPSSRARAACDGPTVARLWT